MCGILGQINQNATVDLHSFNEMRDTLLHRGPDGFGTELLYNDRAAFGHRRLSIIDLSEAGKQPMCNETEDVWLTFNGEIYNFQELKDELLSANHAFKSNTDSEVLIHGYEEWGFEELLKKLKGMFAFAIWDAKIDKVFLARDRFGIKPLYYGLVNESFVFASEIKPIHKGFKKFLNLDQNALADYFKYGHIPEPRSIWREVQKLKPAHFLTFDVKSQQLEIQAYWDLKIASEKISISEAIEKSKVLLEKAVNEHLISDVPLGLFLSGGYDSSTILKLMSSIMGEVNTFTVGFDNSERSEHIQAREIANTFRANHHEQILDKDIDYIDLVDELMYYFDEPFAVSSMIPYYYVSKETSKKVKVALVGDGGDEVFAGYNWQHAMVDKMSEPKAALLNFIGYNKESRWTEAYRNNMPGADKALTRVGAFNESFGGIIHASRYPFYSKNLRFVRDPLKTVQYLDYKTFITGPALTRADRCSMAHSLELRVPFLDHEIYEAFFALHSSSYHDPNQKKRVLYEPLSESLPDEILNMPKRGFSFQYVNSVFQDQADAYMKDEHYKKTGIFNSNFNHGKVTGQGKFQLLILEAWAKRYL